MSSRARWTDRRIVFWMGGVILILIAAVSVLAPSNADTDVRPTTYNTGPNGAKAAFLTLQAIGRSSSRWERPIGELDHLDAPGTTLVLAAPMYLPKEKDALAAAVKRFLEHGGHVLTTGSTGALLLPTGNTAPAGLFQGGLCRTNPGSGPLAAAGSVEMRDAARWAGPPLETAERCGNDAVVVGMPIGAGEAIWWSSASALSNAELKNEANVRLLLLSVGEGRAVVWDESLHDDVPGVWRAAAGLPLAWLLAQVMLLALLLVLSLSRRNGPLRQPALLPRSSPVEFAESMGDLYRKARAAAVATEAARRRLVHALQRDAAVAQSVIDAGPQAVATALGERFGNDWSAVGLHLDRARDAAKQEVTLREALALSRALGEDAERIRAAVHRRGSIKAANPQMLNTEKVA